LLELDAKAVRSEFWWWNFFDESVTERLAALTQKRLGLRTTL